MRLTSGIDARSKSNIKLSGWLLLFRVEKVVILPTLRRPGLPKIGGKTFTLIFTHLFAISIVHLYSI